MGDGGHRPGPLPNGPAPQLGHPVLGDDHVELVAGVVTMVPAGNRVAMRDTRCPFTEVEDRRQTMERSSSSRPEDATKSSCPPMPENWPLGRVSATA